MTARTRITRHSSRLATSALRAAFARGLMSSIDNFKQALASYLPGLLAHFDICQLQARNYHLGHNVGDKDIEDLERLIQESVGTDGLFVRVSGDEWLVFYKNPTSELAKNVLRNFCKEEDVKSGWSLSAEKNGVAKRVVNTVPAKIRRAARCLYSLVGPESDCSALIDQLIANNERLPVTEPVSLDSISKIQREHWACISSEPAENPLSRGCLFCGGKELSIEGASDPGDYTCKKCGAFISVCSIP